MKGNNKIIWYLGGGLAIWYLWPKKSNRKVKKNVVSNDKTVTPIAKKKDEIIAGGYLTGPQDCQKKQLLKNVLPPVYKDLIKKIPELNGVRVWYCPIKNNNNNKKENSGMDITNLRATILAYQKVQKITDIYINVHGGE